MSSELEFIGKLYGRLLVIKKIYNPKRSGMLLECKCICGNIRNAMAGHLRNGQAKSCGCLNRDINSSKGNDKIGKKFGILTIIRKIPRNGPISTLYECKCECGNIKAFQFDGLKSGKTRSCGCLSKTTPTCHPDRPHMSNGLCNACYIKQRRKIKPLDPEKRKIEKKKYLSKVRGTKKHQDMQYFAHAKSAYNVSKEDYFKMLESQNYSCAICKDRYEDRDGGAGKRKFDIDHDHSTGAFRGILCHGCNAALGHLFESPEFISNAIEYLKRDSGDIRLNPL